MEMLGAVVDYVVQNAALIVAACALYISTKQSSIAREHNRLSVRPHIVVSTEQLFERGEARFIAKMRNNGLGPAVIRDFQAFLNGQRLNTKDYDEIARVIAAKVGRTPLKCYNYHLVGGDAYAKDQEVVLLDVSFPVFLEDAQGALLEPLNAASVRIGYASMYGEAFNYDSAKAAG